MQSTLLDWAINHGGVLEVIPTAAEHCDAERPRRVPYSIALMRRMLAVALAAQIVGVTAVAAQQRPSVRPLGPVAKVSPPDVLGSVSQVRPLSGGGVLVNDWVRHQVVLLDREFRKVRAIVDVTPATGGMLGTFFGLLPFKGDSSLIMDPSSLSMLVVDANGEIVRVMALPSVNETLLMTGSPYGTPGVDSRGRLIFVGGAARTAPSIQPTLPDQYVSADSAPLRRVGLATRVRDTLTYVKIPPETHAFLRDRDDQISGLVRTMSPIPIVDGFALMRDGHVAVVRGKDYHVDWLGPDGNWIATPKIAFDWERLDDAGRQMVGDSATAAYEKEQEEANLKARTGSGSQVPRAARGRGEVNMTVRMQVAALQDYRPAFGRNAVRADAEGNLWVRTSARSDAGAIYDVINGKGELVDRVKLPFGRVISGFGPGVVYMGVLDDVGARLEMARIR